MRESFRRIGSAAVFALGFALAGLSVANAESVMKECGADWQAAKAAGTTNGQTWQEFLKSCRAQHQGGAQAPAAAPAAQAAPAPAAPAPTAAAGKSAKECNAEYAANKAAIRVLRVKRRRTSSRRAARATRRARRGLPPPRLLRLLLPPRPRKIPDRCSPGSSPLLRPLLRRRRRRRQLLRPARASSRPSSRPSTAARQTLSFG